MWWIQKQNRSTIRFLVLCAGVLCGLLEIERACGQLDSSLTIPADQRSGGVFDETPPAAGLSLVLRTSLLDDVVRQQTVTSDPVMTRVLEADVRGTQTTTSDTCTQPVLSRQMARIDVVTTGMVQSSTIGFTPQARIASLGNHTFSIRKPVYFDGRLFRTKRAYGNVQVRQQPQGVNTAASGVPLVGPLGDNIAWKEVLRRMPESDAVVVRQLADEVLPKVNDRVDQQLRELNRRWSVVREFVDRTFATEQPRWTASSSLESVTVSVRNSQVVLPAESSITEQLQGPESIAVVLADSAVNRWLALQPIGGLTLSDTALQNVMESARDAKGRTAAVLAALSKPAELMAEPRMFSIRMADQSAVSLAFAGGSVATRVLFQIVPKDGLPGPMQQLTIRTTGRSESDGSWSLMVSGIEVQALDGDQPAGAIEDLISRQAGQIVSRIPPINVPRVIDTKRWHEKLPLMQLHRIQTDGGWLRISFGRAGTQGQFTRRNPTRPYER